MLRPRDRFLIPAKRVVPPEMRGVLVAVPARQLVVLVVDDDPGDVLLIEEALERSGQVQDVHVGGDGHDAVAFLRRTGQYTDAPRPDLILLDLNMPRMNGRQVLAEVKTDPQLCCIPILVFTTSQDPRDIVACYDLHANAYVTKPMNLEDFTTTVARIGEFFAQIVALPTASSALDRARSNTQRRSP
jgi:CheY-like chemotaxis protein